MASAFDAIQLRVAKEGYPFIAGFAVATAVLWSVAEPAGLLGVVLTAWCVYFFRDPERVTQTRPGLVTSPADGVVQLIAEVPPPPDLEMGSEPVIRVSVFMNVFDCHVNRMPVDGRVTKLVYKPGAFMNAALDKASEENERQLVAMQDKEGRNLAMVQIAGLVARRIVCKLREGQPVLAGERMGLIRFGSRVDVYLPVGVFPLVAIGQRCVAGETILADMVSGEPARQGQVR